MNKISRCVIALVLSGLHNGGMGSEVLVIDAGLRLRSFSVKDIELALPWYADPVVLSGTVGEGFDALSYEALALIYDEFSDLDRFIIEAFIDGHWVAIGDVTQGPENMPITLGEARFRQRGIAKKVILFLIERARTLGWTQITLHEIFNSNLASQRLFEACGFSKFKQTEKGWSYQINL